MATGLLALLDDVAALVKLSAATLDDIPTQVAKTTSKVTGVVIDDAAVTPKYVVGLDPKRELSIIYRIARRSLFNKLIFLAPGALLLGYVAPWAITPILMFGGAYLCFEGYEKVHTLVAGHGDEPPDEGTEIITPEELERIRIQSAVNTDLILSAEIIAITYGTVVDRPVLYQTTVLLAVAVSITIAVYGFVALLVKADDIGVYLARTSRRTVIRGFGKSLVNCMPSVLSVIGAVGTAAMLWVGAEIITHGIPLLHDALNALQDALSSLPPFLVWLAKAAICAVGGLVIGAAIAQIIALLGRIVKKKP